MTDLRPIIIAEIRRIAAANGGKPPGLGMFRTKTGISEHQWRGLFWARWSDALTEAGYSANQWQGRLDSSLLLRKLAELTSSHGSIPTYSELSLLRRSDPSVPSSTTLGNHFNSRPELVEALRNFCVENSEFEGVLPLLPEFVLGPRVAPKAPPEGWVYLLRSGPHYKIGRSDQIERRIKEISVALPDATALVHNIRTDDPPGIEAYWHRRFADRRLKGEWFKLERGDVAAFCRRKFQ